MVEIKRDCAVYGAHRERLVFDLMKKFPIGPGNMSVILTMEEAAATITVMDEEIARLTAERDEALAMAAAAYEVLTLTRRAGDLREVYHSLPNAHNRIGDKRSRKGHARDAWLRAFRKADREARAILARLDQHKEVV